MQFYFKFFFFYLNHKRGISILFKMVEQQKKHEYSQQSLLKFKFDISSFVIKARSDGLLFMTLLVYAIV